MRSDEPQSDPHDPADEALDQLLARARWEEPSPDSERRLRNQWIALSRERRGWPIAWTLAAAASVVLMVGSTVLLLERMRPVPTMVMEETEVKYFSASAGAVGHIESRDATPAEAMALFVGAPTSSPLPAVAEVPPTSDSYVNSQLLLLGARTMAERLNAARALGESDQVELVPVLVQMVQSNINRREALIALRLSKNPRAAEELEKLHIPRTLYEQLAADTRGLDSGI